MQFFQYEKILPNVTKITDVFQVAAFLVEGTKEAALIDTCCGFGNLQTLVERQTQLPVTVICTHGHVDHAGGSYGFEKVYLNDNDGELVKEHTTIAFRRSAIESVVPPVSISDEAFVPQRNGGYQNLYDGQIFDLGGITLEAVALPGHTQGMICVLFREQRSLLLGDGCNTFTFLFSPEASSVETYKMSLQNLLLKHDDRFDTVMFSHGHNTGSKQILDECIHLCDEIMTGKTDNLPFEFMGQTALIAKAMNQDFSRVDGKTGNIVYNPGKIFNQ
jgi:hydroxyacylglutathione hydrolase